MVHGEKVKNGLFYQKNIGFLTLFDFFRKKMVKEKESIASFLNHLVLIFVLKTYTLL